MTARTLEGADAVVSIDARLRIAKKRHRTAATFENEVRLLQRLRHEGIVPLLAYCHESMTCWLPLYETDLMQLLLASRPVEALAVASSLLSALRACHAQGVVHRDVKPENVLCRQGTFVLCDFGCSVVLERLEEGFAAASLRFRGTFSYASPEALEGCCAPCNDCWSAGIVIYATLERLMPFDDEDEARPPSGPRSLVAERSAPWPAWAAAAVPRLLENDHSLRWTAPRALEALVSEEFEEVCAS